MRLRVGRAWPCWTLLVAAVGLVAALRGPSALARWQHTAALDSLQLRMDVITPMPAAAGRHCPWHHAGPRGATRPLLLLVLGQSNAGNHGGQTQPVGVHRAASVTVSDGKNCFRVADPLPGGTGRAQSIWSRLEPALRVLGVQREVVVVLLAVDSTTIDDWTRSDSPLSRRLDAVLQAAAALPVDFVLWQQGESDARAGTSTRDYADAWLGLVRRMRGAGVKAPVLAALSTHCRSGAGQAVRLALREGAAQGHRVSLGPDTDLLTGALREDDCHFTAAGLDAAASLWAQALAKQLR